MMYILDIVTDIFIYFSFSMLGAFIREWVVINNVIAKYKLNSKHRRKEDLPKIGKVKILLTSIFSTVVILGLKDVILPSHWGINQYVLQSLLQGLVGYSTMVSLVKNPNIVVSLITKETSDVEHKIEEEFGIEDDDNKQNS